MEYKDSSEAIDLGNVIEILRRNVKVLLLAILVCSGAALILSEYVPHKFKSKAVLAIQSSYFQHPLISDVISSSNDPSEMSAQRLSLLRLALNADFLDRLGEEYLLYPHPPSSPLRALDREMLLKQIEYFSVSPTSFQIAVITGNPTTSFEVANEALAQMTYTLIEGRYRILMQAREAILKQANLLKNTLAQNAPSPQRAAMETQLALMEANLAELSLRYSERHPDVVRLRAAAEGLTSKMQSTETIPTETTDDYAAVFLSPASRASTQEIFNDLLKKRSHLNIVLEMERDRDNVSYLAVIEQPTIPVHPFFPSRSLFTFAGALGGLLLAVVIITFREMNRTVPLSPDDAALEVGLDLLGELPIFPRRTNILFIAPPENLSPTDT